MKFINCQIFQKNNEYFCKKKYNLINFVFNFAFNNKLDNNNKVLKMALTTVRGNAVAAMPFIEDDLLWCPTNDGRMVSDFQCIQVIKFKIYFN